MRRLSIVALLIVVSILNACDASITKDDKRDPVNVGDTVTYTVRVTVISPDDLEERQRELQQENDVQELQKISFGRTEVFDLLPEDVDFVSADPSQGTCSRDGRELTCDLGSMFGGDSATIEIVVRTTRAGRICNVAFLDYFPDDNSDDNRAEECTTVRARPTPTATPTATPTGTPQEFFDPNNDNEDKKLTEEQKKQKERTNTGGLDDIGVEGDVVDISGLDDDPPTVIIANRDGLVTVVLLDEAKKSAKAIKVGDYLAAEGEKVHEFLFEAYDVNID